LGRDQLEDVKREGYFAGAKAAEQSGDADNEGEEEQLDNEEGAEEQAEERSADKSPLDDKKDTLKSDLKTDGVKEDDKDGQVVLPLEKSLKPWEVPEKEGRTEIVVGVRYNKDFEQLFDDRIVLKDRKPVRIVRVKAHFNHEFVVGVQFSYMTDKEELIDGVFHGDKKVIVNNLKKVAYEIQYREQIEHITACFSRGLHWLELKTNEGRTLLLGEKSGTSAKAVVQEKTVQRSKGEELTYVSGGYTGKDRRFTYLAFHLVSGWGKKDDFFKDMKEPTKDGKEPAKDGGKAGAKETAKDATKDATKDPAKDASKTAPKEPVKDTTKDPAKDKKEPVKDATKDNPDTKAVKDPKEKPK
jgi:hypothetical protein